MGATRLSALSLPLLPMLLLAAVSFAADEALPVVRSNAATVSIRDGEVLKQDAWTLAPEVDLDVYEADLVEGRPHRVTFITDVESVGFMVEEGKHYDFIIRFGDKLCHTRILGTRFTPAADFDEAYRSSHRGTTSVEVPEVYELVNVAIAMTPTGIADRNIVYHDSAYYEAVRRWFDAYRGHALIAALDAELSKDASRYMTLKMNGYAFELDAHGRIVQSKVYDRTGFPSERSNPLRPHLALLQSFADETRFRDFYRQNQGTYREQIAFFRDSADVAEMRRWLERNFPAAGGYDGYKIVFSPLVAYNQSATWLESHGFKELQAHINFPYPRDLARSGMQDLSPRAALLFRGILVFTELNHGYINPEADKYRTRVLAAVRDWEHWVDKGKGPNYYRQMATFNEYMNWGLVSLRLIDLAPAEEVGRMIAAVDRVMVERRGFLRFAEFDAFLCALYRARPPGRTVADFYPQIIEWFEKNGSGGTVAPAPARQRSPREEPLEAAR